MPSNKSDGVTIDWGRSNGKRGREDVGWTLTSRGIHQNYISGKKVMGIYTVQRTYSSRLARHAQLVHHTPPTAGPKGPIFEMVIGHQEIHIHPHHTSFVARNLEFGAGGWKLRLAESRMWPAGDQKCLASRVHSDDGTGWLGWISA